MRANFTFTYLTLLSFLSGLLLPASAFSQDPSSANEMLRDALATRDVNTQVLPRGVDKNWYNKAVATISLMEFSVKQLDQPDVMGAVNHPQHLRFIFSPRGYTASNITGEGNAGAPWNTQFTFAGIGRNSRLHEKSLVRSSLTGDRSARYDYGSYAITYDNERQGMEQKFLINDRPAGRGDLQIAMDVTGDLEAAIGQQGRLEFHTAGSPRDIKLVYDQLKVWDRNGKILAASMTVSNGHRLVLKVADKNAVYPITVDPLNHLPSFAPNEGQGGFLAIPNALFGYSICGNVDVNMDGISDIVIGSPLFLNITNFTTPLFGALSVGAAFVFLGNSVALPTTPARVLQPTTVAGALFGFSVASAGDLDKDGFNDIVVGAPGDQVILNVNLLPTLVALGKVYVYNTLTSFVTPAPQATPALTYSLNQSDFNPILFAAPANPCYGFSVGSAGDFNNDGADDLLIGSPFFLTITQPLGRVDLYQSTSSGTPINNATVPNKITAAVGQPDLFGFSLATGNFNGDGFSDILVGAPAQIGVVASSAYIFQGNAAQPATATTSSASTALVSPATGSLLSPLGLGNLNTLFGFSVANAGDINGDGKDDVIIGAPLARDNTLPLSGIVAAGHAYIYYSNPLPLLGIQTAGFTTLSSPRSPALLGSVLGHLLFGYSVGSAGDANLDGKQDVIVGEPGSSALGVGSILSALLGATSLSSSVASVLGGQAYLFLGNGATAATTPAWTLRETATVSIADLLGATVGNLGDVNGDGFPDFFVGAPSGILNVSANVVVSVLAPLAVSVTTGGNGVANTFFASASILPVSLLNFTAEKDNGNSLLNWSTAQEQNSDRFEIERSADNSNFSSIGQVTAAHNSTQVTSYTFTDAAPLSGNNYYRLRMVDLDGKYTYSKVVVLNFAAGLHVISAYPNPATGSFQLKFSNMNAGRYDMSLISATGQTILLKKIQVGNAATYTETIGLPAGIASGTYVIRVVDPQQYTFLTRVVVR